MALQFILGNSGAGKTHYLYEKIIQDSIVHPETNYIILVPEQFTMQTQKDLCILHPQHGIINIDVLSFIRLSHRIFEELGTNRDVVLDDEGKNLILRRIAIQCEKDLHVLQGNIKKVGYISEVKSVISEFEQYGIGINEIDELLENVNDSEFLYYKLKDIRLLYSGFEEYIKEKYITQEELLDVFARMVPRSEILKDSVIVLDGFTGFTPVQNRLLQELLKVAQDIYISVEMDERENPFVYKHPYQLFAMSKQMVSSLVKIALENRIEVKDPVCLYHQSKNRFTDNNELAFLEKNIFRHKSEVYVECSERVHIHAASNPVKEAEFVASQMRRMVRESGYRYQDMAVIVSDMNAYAVHIAKACDDYDIPYFMDYKKSILFNAFVEYIRSFLVMVRDNFSYESTFRFLRTGLTSFSLSDIDLLENYVLALGIHGYKKWDEVWVRQSNNTSAEVLEILNQLRERFILSISEITQLLKRKSKSVRLITEGLYTFLEKEGLQSKINDLTDQFQEEGKLELAKEYSQIYKITMDLFDKFIELLGDENISLKGYCELLDAGFEEAKVGRIPPSLDQIVIGDLERTRLDHIKVLFFMGTNDIALPGNFCTGGILSERDREKIQKQDYALAPGPKEQTYIQKFYLYMMLTKPSDHLYITYSKLSSEGKSLRPAYLVHELMKLYPELSICDEEIRPVVQYEFTESKCERMLIDQLRERRYGLSDEWKELYNWYFENKDVSLILDSAFCVKEECQLEPNEAKQLFGSKDKMSVSRLEKFSTCAYAHFLAYGLRLEEREEYGFEAMDLGNIMHRSLEYFSKQLEDQHLSWSDLSDEQRDNLVEASVEASIADYGNTVLYSSARNEYTISRIKKLMSRSVWALAKQLEQGDFVPKAYELKFGSGKIDRMDTCEDPEKVFVKVTDYKTGRKSFDITAFYHGLQMQLPIYLNAAMDIEKRENREKQIIPAGIFYYKIQDPIVSRQKSDEDVQNNILKELRLDGIINADDEVLEHMEHGLNGTSVYIPVGKNKNGSLSKASKVLEAEDYQCFLKYAKIKEDAIRSEIANGKIKTFPYEFGDATGCDFCNYHDICGFDIRIDGCEFNKLENYSQEEIIELMREKCREEE